MYSPWRQEGARTVTPQLPKNTIRFAFLAAGGFRPQNTPVESDPSVVSTHNLAALVRGILDADTRIQDESLVNGALTRMLCG